MAASQPRARSRSHAPLEPPQANGVAVSYLIEALQRWRVSIALSVLAFTLLTAAYVVFAKPVYTASALLMVDADRSRLLSGGGAEVGRDTASIDSQLQLLRSRSLAERILELETVAGSATETTNTMNTAEQPDGAASRKVDEFLGNLAVKRRDQTYLIEVSFTDQDARRAARIANVLVNEHLSRTLGVMQQGANETIALIQQRFARAQSDAIRAQTALRQFRTEHSVESTSTAGASEKPSPDYIARLTSTRAAALAAESRHQLSPSYGTERADLIVFGIKLQSEALPGLRRSYAALTAKERDLANVETGETQQLNQVREARSGVRQEIDAEITRLVRGAGEKVTSELIGLERHEKSATEFVSALSAQLNQARSIESLQATQLRVISKAEAPPSPSGLPKRTVLLAGPILGLVFGVAFALLQEALRQRVLTAEDIKAIVGMGPTATLPRLSRRRGTNEPDRECASGGGDTVQQASSQSVSASASASERTAALRGPWIVAPNERNAARYIDGIFALEHAIRSEARGAEIICVVSPGAGEGRSMTAINLAAMMATAGHRTLLIDADLRNAEVSAIFTQSPTSTISEAVRQATDLCDIAVETSSGFAFCAARTADHRQLIETISSGVLGERLQKARSHYTRIVIDTPALMEYPDARAILALADAAVFVMQWNGTRLAAAREGIGHVFAAGCSVVVALNAVDERRSRFKKRLRD
jgi:succinoglycan biosynthesis transport protein ExoP